jgi:EAL domain-containing protein (putative c-di-GMP-specific phosphodiesterase class I)
MGFAERTSAAGPAAWSLVGMCGEGQPARKVAIAGSQLLVGRWEDVDLKLDFRGVSKRHSCIRLVDGRLFIEDLGSTNGTFVNGRRISEETPLKPGDVVQFANAPFHVACDVSTEPDRTQAETIIDRATALLQFERLMSQRAVTPHFQPIIRMGDGQIAAFEVLARSRVLGLESAKDLFETAALVRQEMELSRMLREEGVRSGLSIPGTQEFFLNTHPAELDDPRLVPSLRKLREIFPHVPLTMEIHEFAVTKNQLMRNIGLELGTLNIKLAYDDFGAGQARLIELVEVPPHYLKFDQRLIQGIQSAPEQRQQMLATLVRMTRDLGVVPLAEGIEEPGDAATCRELGFELAQGYHFGRPEPPRRWSRGG